MKRTRSILPILLILIFLGTILILAIISIRFLLKFLYGPDKNIAVAIVAGSASILASTIAVIIGRLYQSKQDRLLAHRDKKMELYHRFVSKLFGIFLKEAGTKDLVSYLQDIHRDILLWSSPNVILSYHKWMQSMRHNNGKAENIVHMMNFFLSLRRDLGHSNFGINYSHLCAFFLKNPDIFMQCYNSNSNVSLEEIAFVEKQLDTQQKTPTG